MRMRALATGLAAGALLLAGCGGGGGAGGEGSAAPSAEQRTLSVFAASSLTDVFTAMEAPFEAANPGVDVVFNFGASSDLAQQIVNAGGADVFAAASDATMKTVTDAGLAAAPEVFAQNRLQIAVAPGNPEGITGFADLANPELQVVVCAPQVPCGAAADKVEMATGITLTPVSEEQNVRAVLDRVESGNADAGLVYITDVNSAEGTVAGIDFPESSQAVTNYPIAVLNDAPQAELGQAWQALVTGTDGQQVLTDAGFVGAP